MKANSRSLRGDAALPRVWMFEPRVQHYRVPVFDALRERAKGRYELTILGALQQGASFGGQSRPYFRECGEEPVRRMGVTFLHWPRAEELLRRERPEAVVMAANLRSLSAWSLPRVCREIGASCIGWSKVRGKSLPEPLARAFGGRFFRRFDRMLCYGEQSLEELAGYGYPRERARVFNNTIDTRRIFREGDAIRKRGHELRQKAGLADCLLLVCVGKMQAQKGLDDLLRAWPRLRLIDERLCLVVVGSGPLLDGFRERAAATDPERIRVTGRVPEGDDYAWISTANAFVVPGAVGLAINQSLAFGCPTLIADEPGADAEILRHGETGWRFARGDPAALADAVARVLGQPEEARRISERGRALLREKVTIEHMVDVIDAVMTESLDPYQQIP